MGRWHLLISPWDRRNIKRQKHVTFVFLKIDMRHQDPPVKGPNTPLGSVNNLLLLLLLLLLPTPLLLSYHPSTCTYISTVGHISILQFEKLPLFTDFQALKHIRGFHGEGAHRVADKQSILPPPPHLPLLESMTAYSRGGR